MNFEPFSPQLDPRAVLRANPCCKVPILPARSHLTSRQVHPAFYCHLANHLVNLVHSNLFSSLQSHLHRGLVNPHCNPPLSPARNQLASQAHPNHLVSPVYIHLSIRAHIHQASPPFILHTGRLVSPVFSCLANRLVNQQRIPPMPRLKVLQLGPLYHLRR